MGFRNLTQRALNKTALAMLQAEAKLERTPQDELRDILKTCDIPVPIILSTLDHLKDQLELYAEEKCNA